MMKNEFTDIINGKELIVRKKVASFLESIFKYLYKDKNEIFYDIDHDHYKKIVYSEIGIKTMTDKMYKDYYDAYFYLISNHKTPLTKELLSKFLYIFDSNLCDERIIMKLTRRWFDYLDEVPLSAAVKFHLDVYNELCLFEKASDSQSFIISLMILNYQLLKQNIPTIKFMYKDIKRYIEIRNSNKIETMFEFIIQLIKNNKYQEKSYYDFLKTLNTSDVVNVLRKDQIMLKENYKLTSMLIFGSFSKNEQRIDSDIDLMVEFNEDLTLDEKLNSIEMIKNYYYNIFNRFIDIMEISPYVTNLLMEKINYVKRVF